MSSSNHLSIKASRRPWQEFLLHFSTFGIYSCFWFFSTSRDINRVSNQNLNPWLWFLVPLVFIAQLIALPAFFTALNIAEKHKNVEGWRSLYNGSWIVGFCCLSFIISLSDAIEIELSWVLVALAGWAAFMALLQARMNTLINASEGMTLKTTYAGYSILEWAAAIISVPFMSLVLWYVIDLQVALSTQQPIAAYTKVSDEQKRFQIPVIQEGWSEVDIGTFSSGKAELELKGPGESMYFLVFVHAGSETFDTLAQWRISQAHQEMSGTECEQTRSFIDDSLDIKVHVVCEGKELGDPSLQTITLLKSNDEYYELFGYYSSSKISFRQNEKTFSNMSKGLKVYEN